MPDTMPSSPATMVLCLGNSAGSAPSRDGEPQALEIQEGLLKLRTASRGTRYRPEIARFANTWETAVQHREHDENPHKLRLRAIPASPPSRGLVAEPRAGWIGIVPAEPLT